jgi:hypothetical protein
VRQLLVSEVCRTVLAPSWLGVQLLEFHLVLPNDCSSLHGQQPQSSHTVVSSAQHSQYVAWPCRGEAGEAAVLHWVLLRSV